MNNFSPMDSTQEKNNGSSTQFRVIIVPPRYVFFKDVFSTTKGYDDILFELRKHNLIAPHSEMWADSKKANKKLLIAILKKLRILGYYKNHHNLTTPEIRQICINSFAVSVSVSHTDHTGPDSSDTDFLPPFSAN